MTESFPRHVPNWIAGEQRPALSGAWFDKVSPHDGKILCKVARSMHDDVDQAVQEAKYAQPDWAATPPVERGLVLHRIVRVMQDRHSEIASVVATETGKSYKDAYAETNGAIQLGLFYASEGQRLYGRTTTSGTSNRYAMTIRQPIGVAGLIVPGNTPIANVAWKVFPALICGNAAVLKAAEDTPATAWIFGEIAHSAGLPSGVLNIVQGFGEEAGAPLAAHSDVGVISFTGSTEIGHIVQRLASDRFARVSLELGGKNALIVCDDADLDNAAKWVLLSAFSNAGQRCAAASRIIIFERIYQQFRSMLVKRAESLRVGPADSDDFGPVISQTQLEAMLNVIENARKQGAIVLTGGFRLTDESHRNGFYMAPTLIENVKAEDEISTKELFGPISCLYRVKDFDGALKLANTSPYALTACIHTKSIHRAIEFVHRIEAGVAVVNGGTYGSEPHMPFGGLKNSGNGTREPGTEALDVYSYVKSVYINSDPAML
jgi:aldehyde dehydrogenase (NAD+)